MRRPDDGLIDPEVETYLDAIDATLAGDPVDPRHAEVAELALLVADERPRPRDAWTQELDARVGRRFAAPLGSAPAARGPRRHRPLRAGLWSLGSVAAAGAAAVGAVLVIAQAPSTPNPVSSSAPPATASIAHAPGQVAKAAAGAPAPRAAFSPPPGRLAPATASAGVINPPSAQSLSSAASTYGLQLPQNGRKVIQSAQLQLATDPNHIDTVAQEVFDVVGTEGGIVDRSSVTQTGGLDGTASFALRIPSGSLSQAMTRLSNLRGAQVVARTDSSQDINSQYVSATRTLADAQALRAALLRQLAGAQTTAEIDSLKSRIQDAENAIAAAQASLRGLNAQIDYSQVSVTVSARSAPAPAPHRSGGGFTLGRAAHLAGRVLIVAAGVALVALAVLVPVGLVAALVAWAGGTFRRRRREQALDLA